MHDISRRVREYDADARLVREDSTGHLGIARWVETNAFIGGGYWAVARTCYDLETDRPLVHPDARILNFQIAADSWNFRDPREWGRRVTKWTHDTPKRWNKQFADQDGDMAERFVHAAKRDTARRPKAFIPRAA